MPKKRYNTEDIIHKLREADVLLSQGMNVSQICKRIGIADQTYYRWRSIVPLKIRRFALAYKALPIATEI